MIEDKDIKEVKPGDVDNRVARPDDIVNAEFQPGEKAFAGFLLAFGAFFMFHAVNMYKESPGADSYGALPLFVSAMIIALSVIIIIVDMRKKDVNHGLPVKEQIINAIKYVFKKDIIVVLGFLIVYGITLYSGIGFYFATPVFLWVTMSYLMKRNYVKNLIWTALSMVFIVVVFSFLFSVVLP